MRIGRCSITDENNRDDKKLYAPQQHNELLTIQFLGICYNPAHPVNKIPEFLPVY